MLAIHEKIMAEFGEVAGVRDYSLLEVAIQRPNTTIERVSLYSKAEDKISALLESIVRNHPFIDGNKRTGYILMRYLLLSLGNDLNAKEDEKYKFIIGIAERTLSFEQIQEWVTNKTI